MPVLKQASKHRALRRPVECAETPSFAAQTTGWQPRDEKLEGGHPANGPRQGATNQQRKRSTIKGPLPLDWISVACSLPGRSLHVGIAIWSAANLRRSRVVALTNVEANLFGLNRNAKYRALAWLERAGLIAVERKLGQAPRITILEQGGDGDREI